MSNSFVYIHTYTVNLCILTKQILCRKLLILQGKKIMACFLFALQDVLFCSRILYAVFDSCKTTWKYSYVRISLFKNCVGLIIF